MSDDIVSLGVATIGWDNDENGLHLEPFEKDELTAQLRVSD